MHFKRILIVFFFLATMGPFTHAQQNVGIGISNPHPSAILHLADTLGKGMLIPRTDTNAVLAYVNSLTPNPGIANGLLIYQKTDKVFYFYDGNKNRWVPLSGLVGPTGPIGQTGPDGPRGDPGKVGSLRDTNLTILPTDTVGDYFIQTATGDMWEVAPSLLFWQRVQPAGGNPLVNWRSAIQGGYTAQLSSSSLLTDPFPLPTVTFSYKALPGLSVNVPVGPDSLGWVVIRAYGTVKKVTPNDDYNFAIFDIRINGVSMNVSQIVGMGPNGPAPQQYHDQVSWQLAYGGQLNTGTSVISVVGSQYRVDSGTGSVVLCDGPGTENQAHLDVYVMYTKQ